MRNFVVKIIKIKMYVNFYKQRRISSPFQIQVLPFNDDEDIEVEMRWNGGCQVTWEHRRILMCVTVRVHLDGCWGYVRMLGGGHLRCSDVKWGGVSFSVVDGGSEMVKYLTRIWTKDQPTEHWIAGMYITHLEWYCAMHIRSPNH